MPLLEKHILAPKICVPRRCNPKVRATKQERYSKLAKENTWKDTEANEVTVARKMKTHSWEGA